MYLQGKIFKGISAIGEPKGISTMQMAVLHINTHASFK